MNDFDRYFEGVYEARWSGLKEALLQPAPKISRNCFDGFAHYALDAASVKVAEALPLVAGERVLDMCAAPGGKTLVLLERLYQEKLKTGRDSFLTSNELSFARRKRLEEVLKNHAPPDARRLVKVAGWDASKIGIKSPESFDKILIDAPCSSERHMLEQDPSMKEWKVSRTEQLAMRQYALVCSALLALKPGGVMVYSTCSISKLENEGVIERLLSRKGEQVSCEMKEMVLPDESDGAGPMFWARLVKAV